MDDQIIYDGIFTMEDNLLCPPVENFFTGCVKMDAITTDCMSQTDLSQCQCMLTDIYNGLPSTGTSLQTESWCSVCSAGDKRVPWQNLSPNKVKSEPVHTSLTETALRLEQRLDNTFEMNIPIIDHLCDEFTSTGAGTNSLLLEEYANKRTSDPESQRLLMKQEQKSSDNDFFSENETNSRKSVGVNKRKRSTPHRRGKCLEPNKIISGEIETRNMDLDLNYLSRTCTFDLNKVQSTKVFKNGDCINKKSDKNLRSDKSLKRKYKNKKLKTLKGESLNKSLQAKSSTLTYFCGICESEFQSMNGYDEHIESHCANSPENMCDLCGRIFQDGSTLKIHKSTTHKHDSHVTCYICRKTLTKWGHLVQHIISHKCILCREMFVEPKLMRKHMQEIHFSIGSACDGCEYVGENSPSFNYDMSSHHNEQSPACNVCSKSIRTRSNQNHRCHNLSVKCSICQKSFKDEQCLTHHKETAHCQEKDCNGNVGGMFFKYRNFVESHVKNDSCTDNGEGERSYKCDQCDRAFRMKGNLQKHKLVHTEIKAFVCETCGRSFRRKSTLIVHYDTHKKRNESEFYCHTCSKSFSSKCSLQRHAKTHLVDKQLYPCEECGKNFSRLENLRHHKMIHTGETPYSCDVCGRGFRHPTNLKVHKKVHS